MAIVKKLYPFVAAMFVFMATAAPVEAQGGLVECGWCQQLKTFWVMEDGGFYYGWGHKFLGGIGSCPNFPEGGGPFFKCSRCGGDSYCHSDWWEGRCHILCGPGGGRLAGVTEITMALKRENMTLAVSALGRERSGMSVEYNREAGRIDFTLACNPERPFHSIPVVPELREELETALGSRPPVVAAQELVP